jgi:hypothetical protein
MKSQAVVAEVHALLKPLGFSRSRAAWNRARGSLTQAIDIQLSKSLDAVTVNLGVMDEEIYARFWGPRATGFVGEVRCIARSRIGSLIDSHDRWWPVEGESTAAEICRALSDYGLPFLDRMRSRADIERYLDEGNDGERGLPLENIYLALLKADRGDLAGACETLTALNQRPIGGWHDHVMRVAAELGCHLETH